MDVDVNPAHERIASIARSRFADDVSGHDFAHGRPMYDPTDGPQETYQRDGTGGSVVRHVHEKLLRLPDAMETETGREIAADRAAFVESFVERFEAEWRGER